jgi:hypothetical protein
MAKFRAASISADLVLETSSVLFFCGAAFSAMSLLRQHVGNPVSFIVATSIPAAASLLLLLVALLVPALYAVNRLKFPLNVTLPLVHGSLVYMLAVLTRSSFGLEKPPTPLIPALLWAALLWADYRFLAPAILGQIFVLTIVIGLKAGPVAEQPDATLQR